jgi:hypothetical protein
MSKNVFSNPACDLDIIDKVAHYGRNESTMTLESPFKQESDISGLEGSDERGEEDE